MRLLARDPVAARARLGDGFGYAPGSVTDEAAVERAMQGIEAVYVSLSGDEREGVACVARVAAGAGVARISYLTGSLVREDYGPRIAEHEAKLAAEQAIEDSGVPYTFLRPTYFIDNLPRHVQGRVAVLLGRQRRLLHPLAAEDFAGMVARALTSEDAAGRDFYLQGPEPITLKEALRLYVTLVAPGTRLVTVPLPVMRAVDRFVLHGELRANLDIMGLLARLGERGDPEPARRVLGPATTTVRDWCERRRAAA